MSPAVRRLLVVAAAVVTAAGAARAAHAAAPTVFRPNPVLSTPTADYVAPITLPGGGTATLPPLDPAVTAQAVSDQQYLSFLQSDDLGGFTPAPVGSSALVGQGRTVVGAELGAPQIPHYAQASGGQIQSFAATGLGPVTTAPDNGNQSVPGLGVPSSTPPPTATTTVPPPNQGFGGQPAGVGGGPIGGETTTTRTETTTAATTGAVTTTGLATTTPPPTTTTRPRTTTTGPTTTTSRTTTTATPTATTEPTTTTGPTTTTSSSPPATGPPAGGDTSGGPCGTPGLTITSDLESCRIVAVNMAPGGSATEHMTIRNDSGGAIDLSLEALGTQNVLWSDLSLGVWEQGTPAPDPLPPLLWWAGQENRVTTLAAGASVTYAIELYLPTTAGNGDQAKTAVIDLRWHAQGR
jgi:hypothetical protein